MAELGLQLRVPSIPCGEGEVVYGQHRRLVPLGQPVHIVRREEFDADLVAQARALGIAIVEDEGIDALVPPSGRRRPGQRHHQRRPAADGAGAGGRRRRGQRRAQAPAGRRAPRPPAAAAAGPPGDPRPPRLRPRMIYDFSALAGGLRGYVWLFPVPGGRLNVGLMHYPASDLGGRQLDRLLGLGAGPLGGQPARSGAWLARLALRPGGAGVSARAADRGGRRRHRRPDRRGHRRRPGAGSDRRPLHHRRPGRRRSPLRRATAAPSAGRWSAGNWRSTDGWRDCCTAGATTVAGWA